MATEFQRVEVPQNLHGRVTRALALRVIEAERASSPVVFPNEAELCQQLGVSRSILREAIKVLADKGMLDVRPRAGTRSRPRAEWNLLDPDILGWQAELEPDACLLRDLCEVRLAIEPTASGFAALRAADSEIDEIHRCLERREARIGAAPPDEVADLDLRFHAAVVEASHNTLFRHLHAIIRSRSARRSPTRCGCRLRWRWSWKAIARWRRPSGGATRWRRVPLRRTSWGSRCWPWSR